MSNLTDGGDGGLNPSDKTRHLMSLAKKGKQPHNFGKEQPSTSGILNPAADNGIYTFINLDGRKFIGNRYDFLKEHPEITRKQLGKLFIIKPNKTAMGWSILEFKYKSIFIVIFPYFHIHQPLYR